MAKKNLITTPAGIAVYPWLNKPDTKFNADGEWKIGLNRANDAITQAFVAKLEAVQEENILAILKDNPKITRAKLKIASLPWKLDEESDIWTFSFKQKALVRPKKGEPFAVTIALFDAALKPLPKTTKVGGGSRVRVSFEASPFYTAALGAGLSFRLGGVQVLDLVEYTTGSGASYGFDAEEGGTFGGADEAAPDDETQAVVVEGEKADASNF